MMAKQCRKKISQIFITAKLHAPGNVASYNVKQLSAMHSYCYKTWILIKHAGFALLPDPFYLQTATLLVNSFSTSQGTETYTIPQLGLASHV